MVPYVLKFQSSEFFDSYQKIFTWVRYGMAYLKKVPSQPHNPKLFKKRKGSDFINQKLSLA